MIDERQTGRARQGVGGGGLPGGRGGADEVLERPSGLRGGLAGRREHPARDRGGLPGHRVHPDLVRANLSAAPGGASPRTFLTIAYPQMSFTYGPMDFADPSLAIANTQTVSAAGEMSFAAPG